MCQTAAMPSTVADPAADRSAQAFPILTPPQVETALRFASGATQRFGTDETIYGIGDRDVPA